MSKCMESECNSYVVKCYQCGKCSAGCQISPFMDYLPHQVVRFVQLGDIYVDKILQSKSIWYCAGCQTCFSRCPQQVNLPHLMDLLCERSSKLKKIHPEARKILAFHKSFLNGVNRFGRSFELGLVGEFKLRTFNLFQDLLLAPAMIFKGKICFLPAKIKNLALVKVLFKKS
ncbi:MAG: hypothetical protein A2504_15305 [Bdellovibrionales bacterium RIFOXYD12_FULL_39_22]|nr:MAG: hypothetical protein A2385_02735 [Bdellovibrionales bacterium RIFOXYB1_FULL_39_21]OFZ43163.1 MAG: hypothetical protein A2485_11880 [Bdellovibrionales bacterium RIFOXYC12_FULL_39_17]OFZ47901.1 MAG: hypothetical protein A2404_16520 [Bdellovibrionales bacterium RIFOXYC1_FULL_39_130]OFZ75681.1 MAG: hypothetical protein A2560_13020 [Bdellovibrionales bacterium RIFOXYD1_FULL_39_84]OFZ94171.1 MAG: hypothetical protein A2504_15305 [Bdellovibrionales bacterium RIFOXYD12_FULL_39_22]HLE11763.1 4F